MGRVKDAILEYLSKQQRPVATSEIADALAKQGFNKSSVRGRLTELRREGKIEKTDEGWVLKK